MDQQVDSGSAPDKDEFDVAHSRALAWILERGTSPGATKLLDKVMDAMEKRLGYWKHPSLMRTRYSNMLNEMVDKSEYVDDPCGIRKELRHVLEKLQKEVRSDKPTDALHVDVEDS